MSVRGEDVRSCTGCRLVSCGRRNPLHGNGQSPRPAVDDLGLEVPRGTIGRLAVSGPTGCRYLDDVENQRKYVEQGWNLTGDAYRQDADGYFWYESRTDDMIISSGYNVSAVEVENVLLTHAAVAECAVIGVPDEARGHIIKALVVPRRAFPRRTT